VTWRSGLKWLRVPRWRPRSEEQLEKELQFHVEQHTADLIARGFPPDEARRQARLGIGGPEQVKEECRDVRRTRWLDDLLQDIRYAFRSLRQRPGFAAVILGTLALGTGATTVMFTVVNGVLLKPLAFPEPERLVRLHEETEKATEYGNRWAFAYLNFLDCRQQSRRLSPIAAWRYSGGTISSPGDPEYVDAFQISSDLFSVLAVKLVQGRPFRTDEDRPGGAPVAMVSDAFCQRHYAGSDGAVGTQIVFDGKPYTIVGVAPAGFQLLGSMADVYTPIGQSTQPSLPNRKAHPGIQVIARLAPGVQLAQAQAELTVIGHRLAEQYPESNAGRTFVAEPLRADVSDVRSTLWLLLGAVTLVLLIACVNVANLLLARAVSRERELAMRVALGARRGRLVRQCLTDSAVLGVCGGFLGVVVAAVTLKPFIAFWPGGLPRAEEVALDWRVLLFALGASLASGFVFGLAPALRAPGREMDHAVRASARGIVGNRESVHSGLVASEIALAVVLLISAGMLGRTLLHLSALDPGIDIENVLVSRAALSPAVLDNPARIRAVWLDILDRGRRVPGVQSIAVVDTVPMRDGNNQLSYWTSPAMPPPDQLPVALATSVSPDYLKVMRIPLRKGRFFDDHDALDAEPVVVIDELLAQHAFGGRDPVGQQLWIPAMGPRAVRVAGVVGHVRHWGLAGDDQARVRDQFYYPFAQVPDRLLRRWSELMSVAVRTDVEPMSVVERFRRELRGATSDQVLYEVRTMRQLASATLARQRFLLLLFGMFAALALLLACMGIYGVLAYLNNRRVPEIGVRIALGATATDVVQLVLRQSVAMIAAGVVLGLFAAIVAGRLLQRFVPGMQPNEPLTFAAMILLLITAALFASFIPARRASRIDPLKALRQE
jgi:predicted permease